jgi:hypothetical protein
MRQSRCANPDAPIQMLPSTAMHCRPTLPGRAVALALVACVGLVAAARPSAAAEADFADTAARIRGTLERELFTLSPYRMAHYGLRLYRQTGDARYASLIWVDMAHWASVLDGIGAEARTPADLRALAEQRLADYAARPGERRRERLAAVRERPEYLVLASRLLPALARIDAYGLRHADDAHLRALLRGFDWQDAVTDTQMVESWAAPLANTVFALRRLGEADHVDAFVAAFRARYPEPPPAPLSDHAFRNKLYGQTHIIIAASGYYRRPVAADAYGWLFDSFRAHADEIERRATPDMLAEVGIAFLLAGLDDEPLLARIRRRVAASVSPVHGLIPSTKGATDLQMVEHRNSVAVLLLDWRGAHDRPNVITDPELFERLPFGLAPITRPSSEVR